MSVINTNITSMIGQSNLSKSQSSLQTSMERLSSGLRINSAKDDAAGQAIANRMSAQITGLATAQRNANDGISLAQTAEGSLNQVNDNLQRIRELTVQSQNGTNSSDDLTSIQNEIDQRLNEINRISEETSFNGVKVLSSDQGLKIQVGANDGEAITVNLKEINSDTLKLAGFNVDGKEVQNKAASEADIKAQAGGRIATAAATDTHAYVLSTDNQKLTGSELLSSLADNTSVTFAGNTAFGVAASAPGYTYDKDSDSFTYGVAVATGDSGNIKGAIVPKEGTVNATYSLGANQTIDVSIDSSGNIKTADGKDLYVTASGELSQNSGENAVAATVDSLMAKLDTDATNNLSNASLKLEDGTTFTGTDTAGGVTVTGASIKASDLVAASNTTNNITVAAADVDGTATDVVIAGENSVTSGGAAVYADGSSQTFAVTTDASYTTNLYKNDDGTFTTEADGKGSTLNITASGELTTDLKTSEGRTEDPLKALDAALNQVDSLRSDLGAIQNRFESAITNLSTNETNLSAARSRIEDADYAVEVANMTRAQILQQAGTSVLAQANQLPQNVLSLLG
ncbi:flagellin [Vreelandella nanhaiensis]|uniref:Flagellin n=1 Tax=Vreelandella nanhaiensis TaxID=1258546 RepID=A0A433KTX1_9GAMM|nr:flagellin [Halomonas nanhaiensis]RUR33024.1 flagellin FliC [Halomonas nanhaiensis]